jgi:hypothetical protein
MGTRAKAAWLAGALLLALAAWFLWFDKGFDNALRGEALVEAMKPLTSGGRSDETVVAAAILRSYEETRQIAALWSGLYWGFSWAAAVLGALAGLVLKVESFLANEKVKKDIAATLTVTAAILVTVSTGGEFHRKWQANRTAAAEIEHLGYAFLESGAKDPRNYLGPLRAILLRRHQSILGSGETRTGNPASSATSTSTNPQDERAAPRPPAPLR